MEKTVTIKIPDEIYNSLISMTNKEDMCSLDKTILHILNSFIEEVKNRYNDPLFAPISEKGSGFKDISENHDKYLYGES